MDLTDLKEKLVIVSITAAVFLPLRLLVSQYVSDHWLGNLGIATAISIVLIVLVKKEKLGRVGTIFRNQITKTMWSKSAKVIICTLVLFMAYFGTTILLIERGNTIYYDDKQILADGIADKRLDMDEVSRLSGPHADGALLVSQIQQTEYIFSISYALLNDATHGWLANLHLIMFIEQMEALWLLWVFRKMFKPSQVITA